MSRLVRRAAIAATVLTTATAGAVTVAVLAGPASADQVVPERQHPGTTRHEIRHDVSPPLSSLAPVRPGEGEQENDRIRRMPNHGGAGTDPVVQRSTRAAIVPTKANFDGIGQGFTGPAGTFRCCAIPPDTNAAVGTSQIVEIVNTAFAVLSKTGQVLFGPAATNTLFAGFGGACQSTNDGDGVVRFDALASRWIITQFANVRTNGPFFECVAVSRTADAMGAYNRYAFQYATFPDYPKLSVWPDSYYVTYNLFANNGGFQGAEVCAMNRAAMLAGQTATQQCRTTSTRFGSLLAADVEGGTPPSAGEANTILALGTSATQLVFWKFHVDWTTPGRTTFTGPTNLTVATYAPACGANDACVPQRGTGNRLSVISDRLMFRLAYRNFGDHESLVVNHSVNAGGVSGVRWYELRQTAGSNPRVFQQGTFAPDRTFRWMGSAAMDKNGNIALGYSASSATISPQIRYAARLATDPAGQLGQGEGTIIAGNGSQTSIDRWGDYSSMVVDPADGCTFWYAQEYVTTNGTRNWHTRLASFSLPGCR